MAYVWFAGLLCGLSWLQLSLVSCVLVVVAITLARPADSCFFLGFAGCSLTPFLLHYVHLRQCLERSVCRRMCHTSMLHVRLDQRLYDYVRP